MNETSSNMQQGFHFQLYEDQNLEQDFRRVTFKTFFRNIAGKRVKLYDNSRKAIIRPFFTRIIFTPFRWFIEIKQTRNQYCIFNISMMKSFIR